MASSYRVVYSQALRKKLNALLQQATKKGRGIAALASLKAIDDALRTDPIGFGDPWFELPERSQRIMNRSYPPWMVVYGVHTQERVVFVRTLDFLAPL
jgi:hypothetical protein